MSTRAEEAAAGYRLLCRLGRQCVDDSRRRADDGLLDVDRLLGLQIRVERKIGKGKHPKTEMVSVDALEATDEEFLAYMLDRLDASRAEHRLGFRLLFLAILERTRIRKGNGKRP